ncbi:MAG: hypothetical protein DRH11_06935, partial [Deltaproteobacteria bacterium]
MHKHTSKRVRGKVRELKDHRRRRSFSRGLRYRRIFKLFPLESNLADGIRVGGADAEGSKYSQRRKRNMISLTIGDYYDRCVNFYGNHTAITYGEESYTYNEMGYNANCLLSALRKIGLKKGDTIAFLMANCPEYIFCEYAVAKSGCIRVPLAVLLSNNDHIYMMNQAECKALIYHEALASRVKDMIPQLETVKHFICVSKD